MTRTRETPMRLMDATLAYRAALGAAAYLAPRTTGRDRKSVV